VVKMYNFVAKSQRSSAVEQRFRKPKCSVLLLFIPLTLYTCLYVTNRRLVSRIFTSIYSYYFSSFFSRPQLIRAERTGGNRGGRSDLAVSGINGRDRAGETSPGIPKNKLEGGVGK